jgi:hypothetical protein
MKKAKSLDFEGTRFEMIIQNAIRDLMKQCDQVRASELPKLNVKIAEQQNELKRLREGRFAELQFVKRRSREKFEKLKQLHLEEIETLVNALRPQ